MLVDMLRKPYKSVRRLVEKVLMQKSHDVRSDYIAAVILYTVYHKRFSLLLGQNTFSERIVLRNARPNPIFRILSDKYEARKFVETRVGSKHLIPVYSIIDDVADFDFSSLPSSFVMKATHGSGWVKLVQDESKEKTEDLRMLAESWLAENFYRSSREAQYKSIKPRVMFEKLLLENDVPVNDYKIHCFRKNGHLTQIIQVHSDRFGSHKVNLFSSDWKPLGISHGRASAPAEIIKKPDHLENLLDIANRLSTGINYVRVDLYISSNQIFFGELTFTPGAGLLRFHPKQADRQWATLFDKDRHSRQ